MFNSSCVLIVSIAHEQIAHLEMNEFAFLHRIEMYNSIRFSFGLFDFVALPLFLLQHSFLFIFVLNLVLQPL